MIIKFIPKWHKIQKGDRVFTSGLDNIFFSNVPVGIVTSVEIQSSYKVAHIRTYSDIYHPKTFFLINNAQVTIAQNFDSNATELQPFKSRKNNNIDTNITVITQTTQENNQSEPFVSSIPSRIDQTQEEIIEPEIPIETIIQSKPKKKTTYRKKYKSIKKKVMHQRVIKKPIKKTPNTSTLDLF